MPNFLGYVGEYCRDIATAQEDIDAYIAWARTVPRSARGDVKVKLWSRKSRSGPFADRDLGTSFMHMDREMETNAWNEQFSEA